MSFLGFLAMSGPSDLLPAATRLRRETPPGIPCRHFERVSKVLSTDLLIGRLDVRSGRRSVVARVTFGSFLYHDR